MNIIKTKISEVKLNPNNPRLIKDDNFKKLVQSIKDFPEMLDIRPIVVNADMVILGGNMRFKACKEAGLKEVPIIVADNLTEEQQREFLIKDNVSGGEWDWSLLSDWDTEQLEEWGLEVPINENDTIYEAEPEEDNYEIPSEIETDIVLGDLFEIGEHRLLCGDSTQVETWEKVMDGKLADMVMTDPPYNVDYSSKNKMLNYSDKGNRNQTDIENDKMDNNSFYQFLYDFYTALGGYTKQGGAWYVWHADSEGKNFRSAFTNSGLLLKQCLIWVKNNMVIGRQDYQWKHEPCLYGWKEGAAHYFTNERTHTTVIEDKLDIKKLTKEEMKKMLTEMLSEKNKTTVIHCDKPFRSTEHPTMKPILLLAPLIKNSSKENEIVADGFLGSGSTMVASHQLKRKCYGMELDPKYCDVIVKRMIKLDPTLIVKRNGVVTKDFEL
jgi:site-specific DNA-methyltransferase (adenine-specific)